MQYIKEALKIAEFAIVLRNISQADNKPVINYTKEELAIEANHLIEKLTMDIEDTCMQEKQAISKYKREITKIKKWIEKWR
jgi:hypothetical protein